MGSGNRPTWRPVVKAWPAAWRAALFNRWQLVAPLEEMGEQTGQGAVGLVIDRDYLEIEL